MPEYIEREAFEEYVRLRYCKDCTKIQHEAYCRSCWVDNMLDEVEDAPAADVEKVRHGEWIPTYHTYYNRDGACQIADEWNCSECKTLGSPHWKRCPVCEAKMDGKVEDDG